MSDQYRQAGVDLEAGYESVRRIQSHVARTKVKGAMDSIGAFGGMFDLSTLGMKEPVLVSGTDGVGTKLMIAFAMDRHDSVGIDAVAMCVNDNERMYNLLFPSCRCECIFMCNHQTPTALNTNYRKKINITKDTPKEVPLIKINHYAISALSHPCPKPALSLSHLHYRSTEDSA